MTKIKRKEEENNNAIQQNQKERKQNQQTAPDNRDGENHSTKKTEIQNHQ